MGKEDEKNDEIFEARKFKLLEDAREAIESRLFKKYLWVGILFAVFAYLGINIVVDILMSDAKEKIKQIEFITDHARQKLDRVSEQLEELEGFNKKIYSIQQKADSAEKTYSALSNEISRLRKITSELNTEGIDISLALRGQLDSLAGIIAALVAADSRQSGKVDNIKASLAVLDTTITRAGARAELSRYHVWVNLLVYSSDVVKQMKNLGYEIRTTTFDTSRYIAEPGELVHYSLCMGETIPAGIFVPLLKIAYKSNPEIRYVEYSSHPGDSLYIGFGLPRSIDSQIRLPRKEDFEKLLNPNLETQEFNSLIKSMMK